MLSLEGQTLFGYAWNKAYQLTYLRQLGVQFKKITMIEDVLLSKYLEQLIPVMKLQKHYIVMRFVKRVA